ncbi:MAG: toxin-antitoxin system YwqK family antitoxin, partial [Bacteroidia bacterium]
PNGKLSEETTYAKGRKQGDSKLYTSEGKIVQSAHYKNGKLHGTFTVFEADKKVVTFYKRGNLVEPKVKKAPKDSAATVKTNPEKTTADSTSQKKKLFGSKKTKDKTQPAQQPAPAPEKKPRKPLFRKKAEAEPPKTSSGFHY